MLIDTHCHLDLPPLVDQLEPLLDEARAAGISRFVLPGLQPDGWELISRLAVQHPDICPAYGIHPRYAARTGPRQLRRLEELATAAVAIGEIGLDGTCAYPELQEQLLRNQLRIARNLGLPVLIHCRRAIGRLLTILHDERVATVGGIMHGFSGSLESAHQCLRLGLCIALNGTITRHGARRPCLVARSLPLDTLVLETDAPDLTPTPYRPQPNRPVWLTLVADRLAELRGCPLDEVIRVTGATAHRFLPGLGRIVLAAAQPAC